MSLHYARYAGFGRDDNGKGSTRGGIPEGDSGDPQRQSCELRADRGGGRVSGAVASGGEILEDFAYGIVAMAAGGGSGRRN